MKKTLIALMALAGVASAAINQSDMNYYIDEVIAQSGYTAGDAFSLTLNVVSPYTAAYGNFISLTDGYYVFSNADKHYAFTNSGDGANIVWLDNTPGVTDAVAASKTVTMNMTFADNTENSNVNNFWFAYKGFDTDGNATKNNDGYSLDTIKLEYADNTTTISIANAGVITNVLKIEGYTLKATDIDVRNATTFSSGTLTVNGTNYNIPEPATATLSLLALCGLAARRRRK